jgi:hypothetical protein
MRNDSRKLRVFAVLSNAFNIVFAVDLWVMFTLGGQRDTVGAHSQFWLLAVMALAGSGLTLLTTWNTRKTFLGTKSRTEVLSWEFQHACFRRMMLSYGANTILLMPAIVVFLFYSLGYRSFSTVLEGLAPVFRDQMVLMIVSFCIMLLSGLVAFLYARYTIYNGSLAFSDHTDIRLTGLMNINPEQTSSMRDLQGGYQQRPEGARPVVQCSSLGGRLIATVNLLTVIAFYSSIIWAFTLGANPAGMVIGFVLYVLMELRVFWGHAQLIHKASRSKRWWIVYRVMLGISLGLAYCVFWAMSLVVLVEAVSGLKSAVDHMEVERSELIYRHLINWVVYTGFTIWRTYLLKVKKKMRAPQEFQALPLPHDYVVGGHSGANEAPVHVQAMRMGHSESEDRQVRETLTNHLTNVTTIR